MKINKKILIFKNIIKEHNIKAKAFLNKTILASIITFMNIAIPSIIISQALVLLGYTFNLQTLISSAALYFIIEEIKSYIKEVTKK